MQRPYVLIGALSFAGHARQTDDRGRYRVYDVAATGGLPADGDDGWQDPTFLDSLRSIASTVTLSGNATRTITSRLSAR